MNELELEKDYIQNLLNRSKNGDTGAIKALAEHSPSEFLFLHLDSLKNVDINLIISATSSIEDFGFSCMLDMEKTTRENAQRDLEYKSSDTYAELVNFLTSQTWYRGIKSAEPITQPQHNTFDPDYAVFITNNPLQAASYASKDGHIASFKLSSKASFNLLNEDNNARFSPVKFDREARMLNDSSCLVATEVTDNGYFLKEIIKHFGADEFRSLSSPAINIALSTATTVLDVIAVQPTTQVIDEFAVDAKNKIAQGLVAIKKIPSQPNIYATTAKMKP